MASEGCGGILVLTRKGQDTVKGECQDANFKEAIEIRSFELGSSQPFDDADSYYAVQDLKMREEVSLARRLRKDQTFAEIYNDPVLSIGMRIAEAEEGPDEETRSYEGKDVSEEEACQIEVTKEIDYSSPDLFLAYCSNQDPENRTIFEKAVVYLRKSGAGKNPEVYCTFTFSDVVVVGFTFATQGSQPPQETVRFSFGKCRMEYRPQHASGGLGTRVGYGWSFLDRDAW
jgi:type VI protein secretion system component Hcp